MTTSFLSPEFARKSPDLASGIEWNRWQAYALTIFTDEVIAYERSQRPQRAVRVALPEMRRPVDTSPVVSQAIALTARDRQVAESAQQQFLDAALQQVSEAFIPEEPGHGPAT